MHQISLLEAEADIKSILQNVGHGEEILVMDHDVPFVKMIPAGTKPQAEAKPWRGRFGIAKGKIGYVPDDFNEPLEDFKDYM